MSNELAKTESNEVPAWMRNEPIHASIGNIDASDLKPPQLKMLAGMSPEVMNGIPGASPGNFWMTIVNRSLGRECTGSYIWLRKTYHVWAPRGGSVTDQKGNPIEQKGPLATSSNGITWDNPNQAFKVQFLGDSKIHTWKIGRLVTDHSATSFGSQKPGDPNSKPVATRTYNMLWLIDMPDGRKQLCVLTASRTMTNKTQEFLSALEMRGVAHYFQRHRLVSIMERGPTNDPYFMWQYQHIGNEQDEKRGTYLKTLYAQYSKSGFVTDFTDEADETRPRPQASTQSNEDIDSVPF